jgi:predicted secreted protein
LDKFFDAIEWTIQGVNAAQGSKIRTSRRTSSKEITDSEWPVSGDWKSQVAGRISKKIHP